MPEPPEGGARPRIVLGRVDAVVAVLAAAVEVALVADHVLVAVEEVPHAADVAGQIVGARGIVVDVGHPPFRDREPLAARESELDEGDRTPGAASRLGGSGELVPVRVRRHRLRPVPVEVRPDDVDPVVAGIELPDMDMRLPQVVPLDLAAWQLVAVDASALMEARLWPFRRFGKARRRCRG